MIPVESDTKLLKSKNIAILIFVHIHLSVQVIDMLLKLNKHCLKYCPHPFQVRKVIARTQICIKFKL